MPTVVVRHDQPIAAALEGERPGMDIIGTDGREAATAALPDADIFVVNPSSWEDVYADALPEGAWLQATSAGYAAFPLDRFEETGVTLTNAAGNYGPPVADHAFALALGLARGLPAFVDSQRAGKWNREKGDELIDLHSRTLTIVGLGDLGESVARRGRGFVMDVRGTKRSPDDYNGVLPADAVHPADALPDLLPDTELLVVTVPLTDATRGLIDADAFTALPDDALLVNVARGPVVDTGALLNALDAGDIAGAGLDVFDEEPLPADSPLWNREDVLLTPHVAGRSVSFVPRFVDLFLENYDRRQAGEALKNRIV